MSTTYDNWERLVAATLKREQFRRLAVAHSRESSLSSIQSDFSFDSSLYSDPDGSRFPNYMCNSSATSNISVPFSSVESSADGLPPPRSKGDILSSPYVKAFSFDELKNATRNFQFYLNGEGGFDNVFKGWIDEHTLTATKPGSGLVVAVKKWKIEGFTGHREWLTEINYLSQHHGSPKRSRNGWNGRSGTGTAPTLTKFRGMNVYALERRYIDKKRRVIGGTEWNGRNGTRTERKNDKK